MPQMTWEQAVQWLRSQPEKSELVRACYYDDPVVEAASRYWASGEWNAIRRLLPLQLGKALDLGAGRGISSYALAKDGWRVSALEPDPSELVGAGAIQTLAAVSGLPISVVMEYSESLPFDDNTFELVNCRQVLHHARDLRQTCQEIHRVLKPGGMMVATREHVISRREDLDAFLNGHDLHRFYGGENAFLLEEYREALLEAGFRIVKQLGPWESPINYFPLTEQAHFDRSTYWFTRVWGRRISSAIFSPNHVVGGWLFQALTRFHSRLDHSPGRLYSFVAVKV